MMLLMQAVVDAATVGAQAANDYLASPSPLADQLTAAFVSSWVIQQAKKTNLPGLGWINAHSVWVNRALSVGFAIATTSGIHAFWRGNHTGDGGTFVLALADGWRTELGSAVWKTISSFVLQQGIYQGILKHESGASAADIVAGKVAEKGDELANVVVKEGLRNDPTSLLKLAQDTPRDKKNAPVFTPPATTAAPPAQPIEWNWDKKPDK
jgi:hypothetical protein